MDAIAANAVADALEALATAIRTSTALPGESPKATTGKSKSSSRKPRSRSGKVATSRKSGAKPKAARNSARKVESVVAVEPGDLTIVPKARGRAKPSAKQTVRKRWLVEWTAADGTKMEHRTKFRFFTKAEAAADLLRNRGLDVTITPVNVAFKRKSKTTRQARTAAKIAAAKAA